MDQTSYLFAFQDLIESVPPESKERFMSLYVAQMKSPVLAVGLNAFGFSSVFGASRFYAGDIMLGVLRIFAFVAFFIILCLWATDQHNLFLFELCMLSLTGILAWSIADSFLIGGRILEKNIKLAHGIRNSMMPPLNPWNSTETTI